MAAVGLEALGDLQRQLAGGGEDERARAALLGGALGARQTIEDRQRERGGLAGAGLRAAEDVAAGQQVRDRLRLDGGGRLVAGAEDGAA